MTSPIRFAGVYTLTAGAYGPALAKQDELTEAIKQRAAQQNMPLMVEEEWHYLGMGDSELVRYFITGADLVARQMADAKRKAIAEAIEAARKLADDAAQNIFKGALGRNLDQTVKDGVVDFDEMKKIEPKITLKVSADGFDEQPKPLAKLAKVRHDLWASYVVRWKDPATHGDPERADLRKAIASGNFDIETGQLGPSTDWEPCDTSNPGPWYQEP